MNYLFSALVLCLAIPANAQTAPASDPHAVHAQHQQSTRPGTSQQGHSGHAGMKSMDHAKMMDDCKRAMAEGKCEEHCKAMMDKRGAAPKATSAQPADPHAGHTN